MELMDAYKTKKVPVGINCHEKGVISPEKAAILDNYIAKKQWLHIGPTLA